MARQPRKLAANAAEILSTRRTGPLESHLKAVAATPEAPAEPERPQAAPGPDGSPSGKGASTQDGGQKAPTGGATGDLLDDVLPVAGGGPQADDHAAGEDDDSAATPDAPARDGARQRREAASQSPARRRGPGRPPRLQSTLGYATTTAMKVELAEPEAERVKALGLKSRTGNTRKIAGSDIAAAFVRVTLELVDGELDLRGVEPGDDRKLTERVRQALSGSGDRG